MDTIAYVRHTKSRIIQAIPWDVDNDTFIVSTPHVAHLQPRFLAAHLRNLFPGLYLYLH